MTTRIRKVAVLGAGVMGSGIAAHLANAGVRALLLDIVPPKAAPGEDTSSKAFRNKFALGALANMRKQKPQPHLSRAGAARPSRSATSRTTWPASPSATGSSRW